MLGEKIKVHSNLHWVTSWDLLRYKNFGNILIPQNTLKSHTCDGLIKAQRKKKRCWFVGSSQKTEPFWWRRGSECLRPSGKQRVGLWILHETALIFLPVLTHSHLCRDTALWLSGTQECVYLVPQVFTQTCWCSEAEFQLIQKSPTLIIFWSSVPSDLLIRMRLLSKIRKPVLFYRI